jgi:hypothetical protein
MPNQRQRRRLKSSFLGCRPPVGLRRPSVSRPGGLRYSGPVAQAVSLYQPGGPRYSGPVAQAVSLYQPGGPRYSGPVAQAVSLYQPGGPRYSGGRESIPA